MLHAHVEEGKAVRLVPANHVLSFVIPAFNEETSIVVAVRAVDRVAAKLVTSHEIIVVDDGSTDGTHAQAKELCTTVPIRVIRLSRNFGKEQAIMSGLTAARGEAVVTLDADLQEPLDALADICGHWRNG